MSLEFVAVLLGTWVLGSIPLALFVGRALRVLTHDDQKWLLPSVSPWRSPLSGQATGSSLAS